MRRQTSQRFGTAVVVMACLAATPAWAYFLQLQNFTIQLPGVASDATLSSDTSLGVSSTFHTVFNTRTNNFVGLASGKVTNSVGQFESYKDNPILTGGAVVSGLTVNHDVYYVGAYGNALYVAVGTEP